MTPPPGNVRPDGHGGLRVVIEGIEHLITAPDVAYLNGPPRYSRSTTDGREAAR
jgi:hypothetical protein